jgi:hypothetical protein
MAVCGQRGSLFSAARQRRAISYFAIKLDHQALPRPAKIRATRPQRMLAPQFKSGATPRPEFALNLRGPDSKLPASARPRSGLPEIIESRARGRAR